MNLPRNILHLHIIIRWWYTSTNRATPVAEEIGPPKPPLISPKAPMLQEEPDDSLICARVLSVMVGRRHDAAEEQRKRSTGGKR